VGILKSGMLRRSLQTVANTPYQVFDRSVKRLQRDRVAGDKSRTVDYVRDEVADRMMERFMVRWPTRFGR
jgi:NADH dehydrogenase [ubiquinone] 1 alpha subcomplex assembly factor 5